MAESRRAIVIINTLGRVEHPDLRRFLERASIDTAEKPVNLLDRLLDTLGQRVRSASPAALRFYGQTGRQPSGWIAAADPVYLEPRLDHLCLHTQTSRVSQEEMASLFEHLEAALGGAQHFEALDGMGYISGGASISATLAADELHGYVPNDFLPQGDGADQFRRILSEIEMALHEHPVNAARAQRGEQPVNSLWLWGGGQYEAPTIQGLPTFFGDEPLVSGLWLAAGAPREAWRDEALAEAIDGGALAVVPEAAAPSPAEQLDTIYRAFRASGVPELVLLTRDGVTVRARRRDHLRFWRRAAKLPGDPG